MFGYRKQAILPIHQIPIGQWPMGSCLFPGCYQGCPHYAGIILSIIVIHEHQALRQHNSKKNSRKYVKVSKIELRTFLKLGFLISCGEIYVTIDCPRLHHRKQKWPCGVTGSLRLIYFLILKGILIFYVADIIIHSRVSISSNCTLFQVKNECSGEKNLSIIVGLFEHNGNIL